MMRGNRLMIEHCTIWASDRACSCCITGRQVPATPEALVSAPSRELHRHQALYGSLGKHLLCY